MTSGRMLGPAFGAFLALAFAPPAGGAEPPAAPAVGDAYVISRGEHFAIASASTDELRAARRRFAGDFLWTRRAGRAGLLADGTARPVTAD